MTVTVGKRELRGHTTRNEETSRPGKSQSWQFLTLAERGTHHRLDVNQNDSKSYHSYQESGVSKLELQKLTLTRDNSPCTWCSQRLCWTEVDLYR